MDSTDNELMHRCGQGDAAAFEAIVRRWEARVENVLRRLATPSEAEDLKQETFVRVLLASRRYKANGAFSTWLYRIALNLARDAARRRKRIGPLGKHEPSDGNGTPASASERKERCELIEQSLQALPSDLRDVLVLRHYGDLTFARVADVLKQPESTIKSRTQTALKRLQKDEDPADEKLTDSNAEPPSESTPQDEKQATDANQSNAENPIDQLILERLERAGRKPSTNREQLIRHLYLDLVGRLPTVEEVQQVLNDGSADAYQRLVTRLLDSGEHPYEQFVREQIGVARSGLPTRTRISISATAKQLADVGSGKLNRLEFTRQVQVRVFSPKKQN